MRPRLSSTAAPFDTQADFPRGTLCAAGPLLNRTALPRAAASAQLWHGRLLTLRAAGSLPLTPMYAGQSGTMIVQPSKTVFEELFIEYKYGDFNYNQWRARDGILLRNYFGTRHVMLTMTGFLHYHGYFKPWFNKDNPPARSEKYPSFDKSYQVCTSMYSAVTLRRPHRVPCQPH